MGLGVALVFFFCGLEVRGLLRSSRILGVFSGTSALSFIAFLKSDFAGGGVEGAGPFILREGVEDGREDDDGGVRRVVLEEK
jgi:hypothetical protein